jgi:hypothetical protein
MLASMTSYPVYKLIHYLGVLVVFLSVDGLVLHATGGGD